MTASPQLPQITAEIIFLSTDDGGRDQLPTCTGYMPQIVIQDRGVRTARADGRQILDCYHGVLFVDCPPDLQVGQVGTFVLVLMYHPQHSYSDVEVGATFTVREGPKIVAHGVVVSRTNPA